MSATAAPLNWEASNTYTPHVSSTLPPEVITCLKNARFLHLATCHNQVPHISLMNYTYLASTPYTSSPVIIMTTNPESKKTDNLVANPIVSLLVHDWVSHRPPTHNPDPERAGSPPSEAARSSLASLLLSMNTSAMSRISATINGEAQLLPVGSEEEKWSKDMHLQNNTFRDRPEALFGTSPTAEDGGRGHFIEGEAVRVVVVKIQNGRIADYKGGIQDWVIAPESNHESLAPLVNGI